ncbi:MAG: hypothetical protein A2W33_04520 [Chloroflexi bacterium RBG_16_52_11]|nr:MAG: hypothetical protein A2W33_04520 [Chloroflexi bacterium RBG_16_52_11]
MRNEELAYYMAYMTNAGLMTEADAQMTMDLIAGADARIAAYEEEQVGIETTEDKLYSLMERYQRALVQAMTPVNYTYSITGSGSFPSAPTSTGLINMGVPPSVAQQVALNSGLINTGVPPSVAQQIINSDAAGGALRGGEWTLVGDAPGGRLTPYSELITPSGYVLDAKTTRQLFASGIIDEFRSMALTEGAGYSTPSSSGISSSGTPQLSGGRRKINPGGSVSTISLSTSSTGETAAAAEAAVTAVDVAQEATAVAAQSLTAAESISQNVQQSGKQTVAAQYESSGQIVDALGVTNRLLNKLIKETQAQSYEQQMSI